MCRITGPEISSGSPKFSADGKEIVFSEYSVEESWNARVYALSAKATSQVVSIDLETGKRTELTLGPGLKLTPQFLPGGRVGFMTKAGTTSGVGTREVRERFPLRCAPRVVKRVATKRWITRPAPAESAALQLGRRLRISLYRCVPKLF